MRLCTYTITHDSGLAPNPYHGWCTVSVCTPNRQSAQLATGDWLAGFLTKNRDHRLVYLLQVDERIHLNDYFNDSRFQAKKPDLRGDWRARCGDNFYSQDENGRWKQHRNRFHLGPDYLKKDTRRPYGFIGKRFWYFGNNAPKPPTSLSELIGGRGIRVNHSPHVVGELIDWVGAQCEPGIYGLPNDNPDLAM